MAEVALPGYVHHHRCTSNMGSIAPSETLTTDPTFEMVPNPTFSFPMKPQASNPSTLQISPLHSKRRPTSMHLDVPGTGPRSSSPHRRTTSALPSFSFNAGDVSGLQEDAIPPDTPNENSPTTPKRGHRRGGSEFVGGDSRFGMSNAISSSPTKTNAMPIPQPNDALPVPEPAGRRGHAHRRSAALSSHDVRNIMQPSTEAAPRLSSSLPSTPLDHQAYSRAVPLDRSNSAPMNEQGKTYFGTDRETSPVRPASRPRVGFSDNVEIIPRPLSTISSETESSISTVRGHSVNNSISSMISMGSGSPPPRHPHRSLDRTSMASISERAPRSRSSIEISKRVEKEGEWLKSKASNSTMDRTSSEAGAPSPTLTFANSEPPATPRTGHRRKHSLGHSLGFERRKSEPSFPARHDGPSRLSALSLQEHVAPEKNTTLASGEFDRKSSTRRIKDWAVAKLHRRSRDFSKSFAETLPSTEPTTRPQSESSAMASGKFSRTEELMPESSTAETDLDAVFNSTANAADGDDSDDEDSRIKFKIPTFDIPGSYHRFDEEENSSMVDLDAALGPMRTPPMGTSSHRKTLHSARIGGGPSAYSHRRAESAPTLTPFDFGRSGVPAHPSMADVFEEDEEDDGPGKAVSPRSHAFSNANTGVGVSIVDADNSALGFNTDDGLRIQRGGWEPERLSTSYGNMGVNSRISTPTIDRRAPSIIEETIVEELSPSEAPVEAVQIIEDFEEPRASSLTKSSDSSETPTLLALPDPAPSIMTPETYQTSTFSSPDFARRQGSFDTSRLGTSASSIADNRTVSSCATGEPYQDIRISVDDVPSLTSSQSTMFSTTHAITSHRDFGAEQRTPSGSSSTLDPTVAAERHRKRSSTQSLSQLMANSFGLRAKVSEDFRPQTASLGVVSKPKKEHRLKKLMFWKSKQSNRQGSTSSKLQEEQSTT